MITPLISVLLPVFNGEKYVFFTSITFLIVYKMTTRFKKKTTGHEIH